MRGIKSAFLLAGQMLPPAALRSLYFIHESLLRAWLAYPRGRPPIHGLLTHLAVTLVKMRTNLPYRCLEHLTGIARATLARMVARTSLLLATLPLPPLCSSALVDTTTIRLGRGACIGDYTGYKHLQGIKIQIMVDQQSRVGSVCGPYPASWHDKRIFETAAQNARNLPTAIIGDKAYLGLAHLGVKVPEKRNHKCYKKDPTTAKRTNRTLNRQRIVVEHTFASIKRCKIFYTGFHFTRQTLFQFFYNACIFHNAEVETREF